MGNIILNVQHLLCFTKMCFMGEIFDKNSFIFGKKLNALKNFLLMDERKAVSLRTLLLYTSMLRAL